MYSYEIVLRHGDNMRTHYKLEHIAKFTKNDLNNFIKLGAADLSKEDLQLSIGETMDYIIDNFFIAKLNFTEPNSIESSIEFDYDDSTNNLFVDIFK